MIKSDATPPETSGTGHCAFRPSILCTMPRNRITDQRPRHEISSQLEQHPPYTRESAIHPKVRLAGEMRVENGSASRPSRFPRQTHRLSCCRGETPGSLVIAWGGVARTVCPETCPRILRAPPLRSPRRLPMPPPPLVHPCSNEETRTSSDVSGSEQTESSVPSFLGMQPRGGY